MQSLKSGPAVKLTPLRALFHKAEYIANTFLYPLFIITGVVLTVLAVQNVRDQVPAVTRLVTGGGTIVPFAVTSEIGKQYVEYIKSKGTPNVHLNYLPIGSEAALQLLFNDDSIMFAVTDVDISDEYFTPADPSKGEAKPTFPESRHRGIVMLPSLVGGIAICVNLGDITEPLTFNGTVLAAIFTGQIDMWNDPAIQSLNPDIKLPAEKIIGIIDKAGSEVSRTLYKYLSSYTSKEITGPKNYIERSTQNQMIYVAETNPFSITFATLDAVSLTFTIENSNMTLSGLVNKKGQTVYPSIATLKNAAHSIRPQFTSPHTFVQALDSESDQAYPLVNIFYDVLHQHYLTDTHHNSDECATVKWGFGYYAFLSQMVKLSDFTETVEKLGWILPSEEVVLETVTQITCGETLLWDEIIAEGNEMDWNGSVEGMLV